MRRPGLLLQARVQARLRCQYIREWCCFVRAWLRYRADDAGIVLPRRKRDFRRCRTEYRTTSAIERDGLGRNRVREKNRQ